MFRAAVNPSLGAAGCAPRANFPVFHAPANEHGLPLAMMRAVGAHDTIPGRIDPAQNPLGGSAAEVARATVRLYSEIVDVSAVTAADGLTCDCQTFSNALFARMYWLPHST